MATKNGAKRKRLDLAKLIGKQFPVLDAGWVKLVDVMGSDADICRDTRQTTGSERKKKDDDRKLLRYLIRHRELSPLEQAHVKLQIRLPLYIGEQLLRYRTAHVQKFSLRYREAITDKQKTRYNQWRLQSKGNKQGGEGLLADVDKPAAHHLTMSEQTLHVTAENAYNDRLAAKVSKEQARKDLPVSTYTEMVFTLDLRNLLALLSERMDGRAQLEMQEYAATIGEKIVAPIFPLCWEAFNDYDLRRGGMALSRLDIEIIKLLDGFTPPVSREEFLTAVAWAAVGWPDGDNDRSREREECWDKLVRMGLAKGGS